MPRRVRKAFCCHRNSTYETIVHEEIMRILSVLGSTIFYSATAFLTSTADINLSLILCYTQINYLYFRLLKRIVQVNVLHRRIYGKSEFPSAVSYITSQRLNKETTQQ